MIRRALCAGAVMAVVAVGAPTLRASAAAACAPAWSSSAAYLGGAAVSYASHNYTAKWWTQNESPATHSGQWDVWADQGACEGGGTPPTTPPTTPRRPPTTPPTSAPGGRSVVGYFAEWGVYGRQLPREEPRHAAAPPRS